MSNEIIEINNIADPFDEALEDNYKSVFIDIFTGKLFTTSILPHLVSEMQVVFCYISLLSDFHTPYLLFFPDHFWILSVSSFGRVSVFIWLKVIQRLKRVGTIYDSTSLIILNNVLSASSTLKSDSILQLSKYDGSRAMVTTQEFFKKGEI